MFSRNTLDKLVGILARIVQLINLIFMILRCHIEIQSRQPIPYEDDERDPNHVFEKEVKRLHWRWFYKTQSFNASKPVLEPQLDCHAEDDKLPGFPSATQSEAKRTWDTVVCR